MSNLTPKQHKLTNKAYSKIRHAQRLLKAAQNDCTYLLATAGDPELERIRRIAYNAIDEIEDCLTHTTWVLDTLDPLYRYPFNEKETTPPPPPDPNEPLPF